MPDPARLARALAARGAEPPAHVEWHESLVSTNDRLKALARRGAPEWTVVIADVQTGGRGREGRSWVSPAGGLYLSVLLRPRFARPGLLPLAAGVAIVEAVAEQGVSAELKWPNDVLLADAPSGPSGRKLAGILAEAASGPAGVEWVVVGVGVNVASPPDAFPEDVRERVASLAGAGAVLPVPAVAAAVLAWLRVWYDALGSSPASVLAAWRRRAVAWWGERVEVRTGDDVLAGRALDVDDEGALVIATTGGETRRVLAGEVVRVRRVE